MTRSPLDISDFGRYYALLGLSEPVHWQQVQVAYRRLAQKLHPDKADNGDIRAFHELNQAYRDLKRYHDTFGTLPRTKAPTEPSSNRSSGRQRQGPAVSGSRPSLILLLLALPPIGYLLWVAHETPTQRNSATSAPTRSNQVDQWANARVRVGSSKQEVLRIQGTPLTMEESEWSYGVSRIYFKGELVTGWFHARSGPLKVSPQKYGWVGEEHR